MMIGHEEYKHRVLTKLQIKRFITKSLKTTITMIQIEILDGQ